ncbi:ATPase [Pseudomonas alliivorans]|uniref:ATPase n=1 Tax=Pseudomonas alliivorans TaxID=2810613 RepID=A0ABS4C6V8_9PSED|nr:MULTISPECIES: ATPase [Pseudomonas]MBP0941288.1 ATPase [Pseudomonas alliivorans]MBP0946401.1 ATPase [Pseudomonas alliivorans]MCO5365705.1 ATPase [Pseudomonas alliivorans]MEE4308235.1 ATPase [Pseudomonas alliivorans]MEE4328015.1 ATPase [Pseudomonas alliivorans]
MRNDPYDDIDDVPSLSAKDDDDDFVPEKGARERTTVYSRTTPVVKVKGPSTGPLWALVGALFIAFCGLGWWSFQQVSLMEQQLVATQESFARISEEAAGRLQDISGKVVATESLSSDGEALKQRIKLLEAQLEDQDKQREGVEGQQSSLDKRLEQMAAQTTQQQAESAQLQEQLKGVVTELTALKAALPDLKTAQADQGKLDTQLKSLAADVATLKKQGNPSAAVERLEQDLIVLKSEQENRPAPAAAGNTAEFDAFRAQVTRNINTLTSQIQNLSQQLNARR